MREPVEETVPEPNNDEVIVFEEFFTVVLRMPPHPAIMEILLKYRVQLHQLTPNVIALLSNYFWVVLSFDGEPNCDDFAKHYELHYQPKKVIVDSFEKFQQFGVINFLARRSSLRLSRTSGQPGQTKAWFYCKVPLHVCPRGGKCVHALRLHMNALKFHTKPFIENSGEDLSDDAFIWASKSIRGRDVVEEFASCGVRPLAADVSFEHVKVGLTLVSKLKVPLPRFPLSREDQEDDTSLLARVEQEARTIVGSYTRVEHEACVADLQNNGHLNHVLKLTGVAYGPHLALVTAKVLKKRKADATRKVLAKCPKAHEKKGTVPAKVAAMHVKGGPKWPLDVDILSAKSAKLSKSIIPRTFASAATTHITPEARGSIDLFSALGSKVGGQALKSRSKRRRLPHPLRNSLFWLLGLWLRYL
jgi:hypothetical protein